MKFKNAWMECCEEIKNLAGCYAVIALLFVFVVWQRETCGFMAAISAIAAIAGAILAVPTIMGTMVTVSDFIEELLKSEYH